MDAKNTLCVEGVLLKKVFSSFATEHWMYNNDAFYILFMLVLNPQWKTDFTKERC